MAAVVSLALKEVLWLLVLGEGLWTVLLLHQLVKNALRALIFMRKPPYPPSVSVLSGRGVVVEVVAGSGVSVCLESVLFLQSPGYLEEQEVSVGQDEHGVPRVYIRSRIMLPPGP